MPALLAAGGALRNPTFSEILRQKKWQTQQVAVWQFSSYIMTLHLSQSYALKVGPLKEIYGTEQGHLAQFVRDSYNR